MIGARIVGRERWGAVQGGGRIHASEVCSCVHLGDGDGFMGKGRPLDDLCSDGRGKGS